MTERTNALRSRSTFRRRFSLQSFTLHGQPVSLRFPMSSFILPADPAARSPGNFDWPLCYEAEQAVGRLTDAFLEKNSQARGLAGRMRDETGTEFFEWVDHLVVAPGEAAPLRAAGFVEERVEAPAGTTVLWHPQAMMPRVLVRADGGRG